MIYKVVIEEHLADTFEIEASSPEEALDKAEEMYSKCEIILSPGNLLDAEFSLAED